MHAASLTGLEITDYTGTQQRPHIFRFPKTTSDTNLLLQPGQSAYVFTGRGTNKRLNDGDLLLFAGRSSQVWNNTGDVAYLRTLDGRLVDHMTVGDPARHPGGH